MALGSRTNHLINTALPVAIHDCRAQSRGFTLTEVMFAVILLGIGFIMVAAMFPVALRQTKSSLDETIAAQLGRSALGAVEALATDNLTVRYDPLDKSATPTLVSDAATGKYSTMPATGGAVRMFTGSLINTYGAPANIDEIRTWESFKGDFILKSDPRYAWTMVYRREGTPGVVSTWSDVAQVYIFLTQRAEPPFAGAPHTATDPSDITFYAADPFLPNLAPKPIRLILTEQTEDQGIPDIVSFVSTTADTFIQPPAIGDGAFVIVTDDPVARGKVYRVGPRADGAAELSYELMPGWDMPVTDASLISGLDNLPARALGTGIAPANQAAWGMMFGRGYRPNVPLSTAPVYEGNNMAVYMYVGFVRVH